MMWRLCLRGLCRDIQLLAWGAPPHPRLICPSGKRVREKGLPASELTRVPQGQAISTPPPPGAWFVSTWFSISAASKTGRFFVCYTCCTRGLSQSAPLTVGANESGS